MRLLEPLVPDPSAPLARLHPIAKILAALVLMLALFVTVDLVTSSVVLVALLIAARFSGLPLRSLAARAAPLLIGAASIGLFNAVLSQNLVAGGAISLTHGNLGIAVVTSGVDTWIAAHGDSFGLTVTAGLFTAFGGGMLDRIVQQRGTGQLTAAPWRGRMRCA